MLTELNKNSASHVLYGLQTDTFQSAQLCKTSYVCLLRSRLIHNIHLAQAVDNRLCFLHPNALEQLDLTNISRIDDRE